VNHYCRRGDDIAARSICRYFLDQRSNPDLEIWARVAQIYTDEDLADPNAIERLFADFAHDSQLAEAAFYTPERFYDRALDLERTGRGGQAQGYFVRAARDWEHVAVRLPQTSSRSSQACQLAADCYLRLGRYDKAIDCYQYIVDTWPDSQMAWNAQFMVGYSYERLKKGGGLPGPEADLRTRAAYQQLLVAYPDCPAAKAAKNWLQHDAATGEGGQG
jgi:tetratricopeptide (TPR) repeat protein